MNCWVGNQCKGRWAERIKRSKSMSSIWNNLKLVILSPWTVTARFLNQPATFLEVKDHQHDLDQPPILHMEKWLKDAQLARQSWQTHHAAPGGGDGQRMVTFKSMRTPALMLVTIDWILLRAKEGAACFMGFISFHSYNDPIRWPYYSHFTDENTEPTMAITWLRLQPRSHSKACVFDP